MRDDELSLQLPEVMETRPLPCKLLAGPAATGDSGVGIQEESRRMLKASWPKEKNGWNLENKSSFYV